MSQPKENIEMSEIHYSSSYYKDAIKFDSTELKERLLLARRILHVCKQNTDMKVDDKDSKKILEKVHEYTAIPIEELRDIEANMITRDRSLRSALKRISNPILGRLAEDIRCIFIKYYLVKKVFPKKVDLLRELRDTAMEYICEDLSIEKLVKKKLVKYHQIPEYNRYILMEHPENIYNRTIYLKAIEELRSQRRNIIYVSIRKINLISKTLPTSLTVGLAAMPKYSKLERFLLRGNSEMNPTDWLKDRVLKNIHYDSVVVLCQPGDIHQNITPYSRKTQMKSWMDENGIEYESNPHTSDLYSLYQTFKGRSEAMGAYGHIFQKAGLQLIQFSEKWPSLDYFKLVWAEIMKYKRNIAFQLDSECFKSHIKGATDLLSKNLVKREIDLINEEIRILKADAEMEKLTENLLEIIKKGKVDMKEFPEE